MVHAGRTAPAPQPRLPARPWARGGSGRAGAGPRSALPAATTAGAKCRRQAIPRMWLTRSQRVGAMAAPGAARAGEDATRLRDGGLSTGRKARAVRGGAGAALARPRWGQCRCAPPPPTASRTDPSPRQLLRAPSCIPPPLVALSSPHDPPLRSPVRAPPVCAPSPPGSARARSDSASPGTHAPLQSPEQAPLGSSPGACSACDAHDLEMRFFIRETLRAYRMPGAGQRALNTRSRERGLSTGSLLRE